MEIRVLRYFLAVAYEESISGAADNILHVTQPTLSRQMMELEEELGVKLFVRSNRKTLLTEDGMRLRKRAEEIIELVDRTTTEFSETEDLEIAGEVCIGGGESDAVRLIAETAREVQKRHPGIKFRLYSGNAEDVAEKLEKGLLDFGIMIEPIEKTKYEFLTLPLKDTWGVLMRADDPLASKKFITAEDLKKLPIIISYQNRVKNMIAGWQNTDISKLNVVASYNLIFNAALMVEAGLGYAVTLDKLTYKNAKTEFKFVPLKPLLEVNLVLVWKQYTQFSKAAQFFLNELNTRLKIK